MYPNDQQSPTYSIDYLNQIAPVMPKKSPLNHKLLYLIGAVVVIILIIVITALSLSGSPKSDIETLAARLQATSTIATDAKAKLKSTPLRTLNSNLTIYLANTNRDIVLPLTSSGIDSKKLNKSIVAKESGAEITKRLEDARLNAVYDRTYAREMAYQLETIIILMRQLNDSTNDQDLKTFLQNAYTNLLPTQKQFADFNAANG